VQFLENGTLPIRLVVNLPSTGNSRNDTGATELRKLSLDCSLSDPRNAHNLSDVKEFVSMREKQSQNCPSGFSK